jgi:hypothetical protein
MRCVLVSDGNLKADTRCAYCQRRIGESYAREISTHFVYCGYDCYQSAEQAAIPARNLPANTWKVHS